jgi:HEAT repeat protein
MNIEPENSPQSPVPDPLDQLLSEARWPSSPPAREARLVKHWDEAWHARRRHERMTFRFVLFGIAASLLVGVVLGWTWLKRGAGEVRQPMAAEHRDAPTVNKEPPTSIVTDSAKLDRRLRKTSISPRPSPPIERIVGTAPRSNWREPPPRPIVTRPPTKLEEMLLMANVLTRDEEPKPPVPLTPLDKRRETPAVAHVTPSKTKQPRASRVKPKKFPEPQAVAKLASHPNADPAQVAAALRSSKDFNESRLVAILGSGSPAERNASLKLLGELGSARVVPDVLRATADANLHVAAIHALSRIADSATIEQLAHEEASKELQRVLLAALLGRGDVESLRLYLSNVASEPMTETALAAAEQTPHPPMDLLFAVLRSPSELERLTAARVIGRIDGPATTERLIALLEESTSRQEACVALLTSRGQEAVNFVNSARTNPALAAALQAASVLVSTNSSRS